MLVYIHQLGGGFAMVTPIGAVDPGFGIPDWSGGRPDNSLPGAPVYPGNRPPGSWGGRPDNSLPGSPGHPDNRPPSGPPPQVGPGETLILVRDPAGVWHYHSLPSGSPPPRPVPVPPTAAPKA